MIQVKISRKTLPRCNLPSKDDTIFNRLGLNPYPHQLKSYFFLTSRSNLPKIVFNTCGTGLGKTYSAALPLLELNDAYSVFIYPTNALIDDQYSTLTTLIKKLVINKQTVLKATARELVKYSKTRQIDRRELLEDFLSSTYSNLRILVTNPDLFYIALGLRFSKRYAAKISIPLIQRFNNVIFDEFHLYNWKQLSNILFFMRVIAKFSEKQSNFVFLSATPSSEFLYEVRRIFNDAEIKIITENENIDCKKTPYKVVADVTLEIHKYDNITYWFKSNINYIRNLIKKNLDILENDSESKIVIILNSVHSAQRVKKFLEDSLKDLPVTIGAWHGMNRYTRTIEKDSNIIIGTSAIEVGIDFKAIVLIFEADNAASFIQRFGRVGRVANKPEWTNLDFKAIALIPTYVYNYIKRVLNGKGEVSRDGLSRIVYDAFEERTKFKRFKDKYAPIEHYGISLGYVSNTYNPRDREELQKIFEQIIYDVHPNVDLMEVKDLFDQYSRVDGLLDELYQFRGSLFEVPLFDKTLFKRDKFPFNIYNLFYCLRHFEFSIISRNEFMRLTKSVDREEDAYKAFEFELHQLLKYDSNIPFLYVTSRDTKRSLYVKIHNENDLFTEKVEIDNGFILSPAEKIYDTRKIETLRRLNNWLSRKRLVYFLVEEDVYSLRNKLKLSPYFLLLPFEGSTFYGEISKGSISFGLNAFLLSSELEK